MARIADPRQQSDLVRYAGGLWRKQWLLEHESSQKLLPW